MTGEHTLLANLFSSEAAYRLTLSLGHMLWQAVAIGVIALLVTRALRSRSAQARHLTHMAALLAMVLCLPANLLWISLPPADAPGRISESEQGIAQQDDNARDTTEPTGAILPDNAIPTPLQPDTLSIEPGLVPGDTGAGPAYASPTAPLVSRQPGGLEADTTALGPAQALQTPTASHPSIWRTVAPWVVPIYCLGLLLTGLRLILAYRGGQQLRKLAVEPDSSLLRRFRAQAARLGFPAAPDFAVLPTDLPKRFAHVGPVVIGVLKPIVLLPAAAITQMTPAQVEAVLAHELAHIKRYDPWLMLFQRAAETVLFFHPMVWLISRLASVEREHACDDLALKAGAQPEHYAEALLHFAKRQAASSQHTPRSLAATALAMAQHSAEGKDLEHRLARLFGQRIANPLRLTRKGLIGLALVGLVGLTALITTTRAQPPGSYFAEEETIPEVTYPDPAQPPHPPIAMEVKYVRPDHTGKLFSPAGVRLEKTWEDFGGHHPIRDDNTTYREVIIDLPDQAPHLEFTLWESRFKPSDSDRDNDLPFIPRMCYRSDGSRYILAPIKIKKDWYKDAKRFDLTLAYHAGDQRGPAEAAFQGPFRIDTDYNDPTGRHTARFSVGTHQANINGKLFTRTHHLLTIKIKQYAETPNATTSSPDVRFVFYGIDGKPMQTMHHREKDRSRNPDGTYDYTFEYRLVDDLDASDISRIAFEEQHRSITFRNVVLDLEDWEGPKTDYAPYIQEMARRLNRPLRNDADARQLTDSSLTVDEAFKVIEIVKGHTAQEAWWAFRNARLNFLDLSEEEQAKILAAAEKWIDASDERVQAAGLKMGLWTRDMRFWKPAIRHIEREAFGHSDVLHDIARYLPDQLGPEHLDALIGLLDTPHSRSRHEPILRVLRSTGSHTQPPQRRAMTEAAHVRLARHDDPWVWQSTLRQIDNISVYDADQNLMRQTVLPRLATESDEMLRRCQIIVADPQLIGQPLRPVDELRFEELFTAKVWRMSSIGDFFDLCDRWISDDPADLRQWDMVISLIEELDAEWSLSRGDGWSRDNSVIIHRIVQHLNAVFDQDFGQLGQVKTDTPSRISNGKDYRQIARDVVAWYRGPIGPSQEKRAELMGKIQRSQLVGTWRLEQRDRTVQYTDALGRPYIVTQTLTLREDGSAVRQTVKAYEDDQNSPVSYERLEGHWTLGNAGPLDGGGFGLFLATNPTAFEKVGGDPETDFGENYLGGVQSVDEDANGRTTMSTSRWGGSIVLIDKWQRIDEADAAKLIPGSKVGNGGAADAAEAFIAALLTGRVGDAHALTHELDERRCGRFAELALLDLPDDFGATVIYHDLREHEQEDEAAAGETSGGGGKTIGMVFAPIVVPADLAEGDSEMRMALVIETQQVDGSWRVTDIQPQEMGEDFSKQFQQAHDAGQIEKFLADPSPLVPRIVGYKDPKPLGLHQAVMQGDLEKTAALLDEHPEWINVPASILKGNTPLHTAFTEALWHHDKAEADGMRGVELFNLLLDRGADINATTERGRTVLSYFCGWYTQVGSDQTEAGKAALKLLIERGADVNHPGDGRTPLYSLAMSASGFSQPPHERIAEAAAILLEAGADVNAFAEKEVARLRTPVHIAIYELNPHLLDVLLENDADLIGPAMQATPPLHLLAQARYRNNTSDTERKAAVEANALACAKLLVEAGADPWTRINPWRLGTPGSFNHRNMEATAWDIATDGPTREYLAQLMAIRRAELEKEISNVCQRFLRAALKDDQETIRATTAEIFTYHDARPTDEQLPQVIAKLREDLDLDLDAGVIELPVVSVTGRLREGGIMLKNKEGAEMGYTALIAIHDGKDWRVVSMRQSLREDVMGPLKTVFNFERDAIDYVRYQTTGELPVLRERDKPLAMPMGRAKTVTFFMSDQNQLVADWHSQRGLIAHTELGRDDTEDIVHIDRARQEAYHYQHGVIIDEKITLTHNRADLPGGMRITTDDGQLVLQQHGVLRPLPKGTRIQLQMDDHGVQIFTPEGDVDDANAKVEPKTREVLTLADAFVASLLMDNAKAAHAFTHGIEEEDCARYTQLAMLDLPEGFGIERVYRDVQTGQVWVGYTPFKGPKHWDDGRADQRFMLQVELRLHEGRWRVVQVEVDDVKEDFLESLDKAVADGETERVAHDAAPLLPRIVGYDQDRPIHAFKAVIEADTKRLGELLDNNPEWVKAMNAEGNTLLIEAAWSPLWYSKDDEADGQTAVAIMRLLLERAADVNAKGDYEMTALQRVCARYGSIGRYHHKAGMDAIQLLIEHGADVNAVNKRKHSVLHQLAYAVKGHGRKAKQEVAEAAELLLKAGAEADHTLAEVDQGQHDLGFSPLHAALNDLQPELVALLLEYGADPNGPVEHGRPSLHLVAEARTENNYADEKHQAPIDRDALACAKLLIDAGVDPWTLIPEQTKFIRSHIGRGLRKMGATAYDIAIDSPMRDYLEEVMAPQREEYEKQVQGQCELFVRAILKNDIKAARAMCTEVWMINDPHLVDRALAFRVGPMQQQIDFDPADLDNPEAELPIVSVVGRPNGGAILLQNKPGSPTPYTAVVALMVDGRLRIAAVEPERKEDAMNRLAAVYQYFDESIHYNAYLMTSEIPPVFEGSRGGGVFQSKTAIAYLDEDTQLVLDWHSTHKHLATTQLNHSDSDGVLQLDHDDLSLFHARSMTLSKIELTHNLIKLPDGTQISSADGRLTLQQGDGQPAPLPSGTRIKINVKDHDFELAMPPDGPGALENAELDPAIRPAIETAEAFASSLLMGDPATAHALTHDIELHRSIP